MSRIPLFKVAMSPQATADVGEVLSSGFIGQGPRNDAFEADAGYAYVWQVYSPQAISARLLAVFLEALESR
jgi:hypothetical protein